MTTSAEHKTIKGELDRVKDFNGLKKVAPLNSELAQWMHWLATDKVFHRKFEFDCDTFTDDYWTSTADATATDFAAPATQLLGGVISGVTGTTDDGGVSLHGPKIYKGDNRAYMHVRFKVSAASTLNLEMGFIDAFPTADATLPVISDVDTPAVQSGAVDLAVMHMDTDQTLKTLQFVTQGSTSGMTAAKQAIGTLVPVAATYMDFKMMIDGNDVAMIVDNKRIFRKTKVFGIEGGTLVMPWIYVRCRAGAASRTLDIDLIEIAGERA